MGEMKQHCPESVWLFVASRSSQRISNCLSPQESEKLVYFALTNAESCVTEESSVTQQYNELKLHVDRATAKVMLHHEGMGLKHQLCTDGQWKHSNLM